ncbi:MAG: tRNA (adenosine(37)-N6)-dimethylallyltransferase MiaA [Candidatus Omnitrophica bacterium]|nr:tRNA (adenosine(37)-N6)-dimethylallyltransferase MiaA [Candidatus Omnitrophota bacterium]
MIWYLNYIMGMATKSKKRLLVIGGPTSTGKSDIAYNVALKINGEIISADSMQFYREINVGTDKVPLWMRERVPHHLIDFLSICDDFDVYQFIKLATGEIDEILRREKIPIVVGGSGLYLRCLLKGIFYIPDGMKEKQKDIRDKLENENTEILYQTLQKVDHSTAKVLHPNDRKRIRRALEVYYLTGKQMSLLQKERSPIIPEDIKIHYYILTRDRKEMYNRIDERVEKMFESGWIEEVRDLRKQGYEEYLRLKAPIGYKEILEYLDGKYTMDELKAMVKKRTKNLARRQLTWFRKEDGIWIEIKGDGEDAVSEIVKNFKGEI